MQLVVDVNVLFSAVIKDSFSRYLMFSDNLQLYAPEFILIEFAKYKDILISKTQITLEQFDLIVNYLMETITIVSEVEYETKINIAKEICPDKNDIPYFALCMKLNVPLWSNDKALKNQKKIIVYSTDDLVKLV